MFSSFSYFLYLVIEMPTELPTNQTIEHSVSYIPATNRSYYPSLQYNSRCNFYPTPYYSEKWDESFLASVNCFLGLNPSKLPYHSTRLSPLEEYSLSFLVIASTPYTRHYTYDENGIVWVFASNVCFNFKKQIFEVFGEPRGMRGLSKRIHNFQWRWVFKYTEGKIPDDPTEYPMIDEEGSWIIIPGWLRHTSHLAQNAIMVNYHLHHKEILPPVLIILLIHL